MQILIGTAISAAAMLYIAQILNNATLVKTSKEQIFAYLEAIRSIHSRFEMSNSCTCSLNNILIAPQQRVIHLDQVKYYDKKSNCTDIAKPLIAKATLIEGFTVQELSLNDIRMVNDEEALSTFKIVTSRSKKKKFTHQKNLRLKLVKVLENHQIVSCKDYPSTI